MNGSYALLAALHATLLTTDLWAQRGGQVYTEPDLSKLELPILERAKQHPEELWQFLTDPATPFDQALAAADRCGPVFPLDQARALLVACHELTAQRVENGCGVAPSPLSSMLPAPAPPLLRLGAEPEPPRERLVLGRAWTPPAERVTYPSTWEQALAAPWPWRVDQVVQRAWTAFARKVGTPRRDTEHWWREVRLWQMECKKWPLVTDEDAQLYFEATSIPTHGKSTAVLARWRRILLDPNMPQAATRVASALGEAQRLLLYGDDDARFACQVLLVDGVTHSPHRQASWYCALQLPRFRSWHDREMKEHRTTCPPAALLAVGDLAVAPPADEPGGAWNLLYCYAYSLCEVIDEPPIAAQRSLGMDKHDIPGELAAFAAWWKEQRPTYAAAAEAGNAELQRMRERLEELAR